MSYFTDLYDEGFNPSEDGKPSSADYTVALKQAEQYTEKILALLDEDGKKLLELLLTAKADIVSFEIAKAFEQGAVFAGNIVLELCRN